MKVGDLIKIKKSHADVIPKGGIGLIIDITEREKSSSVMFLAEVNSGVYLVAKSSLDELTVISHMKKYSKYVYIDYERFLLDMQNKEFKLFTDTLSDKDCKEFLTNL